MNRTFIHAALVLSQLVTLVALGAATARPAAAQPTPSERAAMEARRTATEAEARQTIEALFSRLCPGRCELVELKATVESPRAVGAVAPGFDFVESSAYEVAVKNLDVTVLLDSKLPRNFQSNIPRMLQYRLAALAPVINVRPEVLDFPEPQLQPLAPLMPEPPRRAAEPPALPPPPMPAAEPPPEPAADAPAPAPPVDEAPSWQQLLPWIALLLTLLILSGLIILILRRLERLAQPTPAPDAQKAGEPEAPEPRPTLTMPDVDALRAELKSSRAVQNRVLRRWLDDDIDAVGTLVRLLGPDLLNDLRSDATLRPQLEAVSEAITRQAGPITPEDAHQVVDEARARLTAVRVLHDGQGLAMDWEFLEGLSMVNLRRIFNTCSTSEKAYVINQLPPVMRARYLEGLGAAERREFVLGAGSGETLTKQQAIDLAARLRKAADELSHVGREAEGQATLVLEMLRALGLAEQEDVLRDLHHRRADVAEAVFARVCIESTLLDAPPEVLADAMHRTPVEALANFLRGTRADVRDHLMTHAPGSNRQALATELSLGIPVGRADFLEARHSFTTTIAELLRRDGHDLAQLNLRVIARPQTARTSEVPHEKLERV